MKNYVFTMLGETIIMECSMENLVYAVPPIATDSFQIHKFRIKINLYHFTTFIPDKWELHFIKVYWQFQYLRAEAF